MRFYFSPDNMQPQIYNSLKELSKSLSKKQAGEIGALIPTDAEFDCKYKGLLFIEVYSGESSEFLSFYSEDIPIFKKYADITITRYYGIPILKARIFNGIKSLLKQSNTEIYGKIMTIIIKNDFQVKINPKNYEGNLEYNIIMERLDKIMEETKQKK